ncbi:MAG: MarR family transcriptional regulator [Oscillospiraceae bacterium]|jgi:DNA-binding MarR family transcriptional regulator|nr:MarR family transcriptional regulator [Oscillospiraceae bacterium]
MTQLQWLLHRRQIRLVATGGPLADTSRGQGRILALLKMHDGISTKDLAYLLGIRVSSLNELLAKLERGGYVARKQSETDGRVSLVTLTERGRSEQTSDAADPNDILSCLSDAEQSDLSEYLERVITALESEEPPIFHNFPQAPDFSHPPDFSHMPDFSHSPGFPMTPPFAPPAPMFNIPPVKREPELAENCPCKFENCDCYRDCMRCKQTHHFSGTQTSCGK